MTAKKHTAMQFIIFLICFFAFPCFADEILFQNEKGLQTGVVVKEDDQGVTIRFSKEAIKSIIRKPEENPTPPSGKVIWEEGEDYLIVKIPRRSIQIVPGETQAGTPSMNQEPLPPGLSQGKQGPMQAQEQSDKSGKAGSVQISSAPTAMNAHQELMQEEMGGVQGVILWDEKPLKNAEVKIVLESYTGFSFVAVKKLFAADQGKPPQDGIILETKTDSQGFYVFHKAPPGYYRLYWLPDTTTGWVRRLRENPDFEVISGKLTIANVPEKKN